MEEVSTEAISYPEYTELSKELNRPAGFKIILTLLIVGVCGHLFQAMPQIPVFIFGKILYGLLGSLLAFIFGLMGLIITYGLYKLKKIAWTFGLPWLLFETLNGFIALFIFPPINISSAL